ncbi:MAG: TIGR02281 family clan AA aspartic protease [Alphaproteobacteria bacterium]
MPTPHFDPRRNSPDRAPPPGGPRPGGFGRVLRWLVPALVLGAVVFFVLNALPSANLSNAEMASATGLAAVVAAIVLRQRDWGGAGKVVKAAAIWIGLGVVLLVGYSFRDELGFVKNRVIGELDPSTVRATGDREMTVRASQDGHFYLRAEVNGRALRLMVDTGATFVSLSRGDAERIGLKPDQLTYDRVVSTANGRTTAAAVTIPQMRIGPVTLDDVRAHVSSGKREDDLSLFGLSGLRQFRSYEVKDGALILRW